MPGTAVLTATAHTLSRSTRARPVTSRSTHIASDSALAALTEETLSPLGDQSLKGRVATPEEEAREVRPS